MRTLMRKIMILLCTLIIVINSNSGWLVQATEATDDSLSGELEVFGNIDENIVKDYIEGFQKKYPNVTVNYQCFADYEGEIKERMKSTDYGDVLMVPSFLGSGDYATYLELLGDFDTLSEKYNYVDGGKYVDNNVYGIPSSAYLTGILYNKDVFYKAGITDTPKTIDEFLEALEAIKNQTDAIPFYTNYSDSWALQSWESFPYIEMTGNPNYRNNEFVDEVNPYSEGSTHYQVYKLLYDIVDNGLAGDTPLETNWENSKTMLNRGEIGCMVIGSWAVSQFKNAGDNGDAIGFMPFPNEIDGKQYMTILTDYCYGINKNSNNKKLARAYIDYMLDESGYALEQDTLSIVKTDPFAAAYGNMDNTILYSNSAATTENYEKRSKLSSNLNLEDMAETQKVIEAAVNGESFDAIIDDWNKRWESSRTEDMVKVDKDVELIKGNVISENYEVNYSGTEKEYLNAKDTLKVGYLKNLAPFQSESQNGFEGVAAEICNTIGENTGFTMEYVGFDNTSKMVEALTSGEIEMIAGIEKSDAYTDKVKFSKGYLEFMNVIIKNETVDMTELQNKKMAVVSGEVSKFDSLTEKIIKANSVAEAIKDVEQLEADYTVTNYYSANYYIQQEGYTHVTMLPLTEQGMQYLGFSKDVDTRLVSICNKSIYSIPDEKLQMNLFDYMDPDAQNVTLKRFIEAHPIQFVAIVLAALVFVLFGVFVAMREKMKSAEKHAMDMQRYEILSSLTDEYVYEYNFNTNIVHFDEKFGTKFNFSGDKSLQDYKHDDEQLNVLLEHMESSKGKSQSESEAFLMPTKDGNQIWCKLITYIANDRHGVPQHMIGKLVSVQKDMEEKQLIQDKAERDPLTSLYNRQGFERIFNEKFHSYSDDIMLTVAIMDLDYFKSVNDTLGHVGGDEALKLLARTLVQICPKDAVVARYGGDEFVVSLFGYSKDNAATILQNLVTAMDTTITFQPIEKALSISVGAVYSTTKLDFDELYRKADKMLYMVKEKGRNGYQIQSFEEETE